MADINPNDSATLTDGLEIDSYDDVVNLLGAGEAAAMLADAVGNRSNRQDIMKAILNGGDIHLDYWPEYGEYDYAARICGELLADTSLAWADDLIDPDSDPRGKGFSTVNRLTPIREPSLHPSRVRLVNRMVPQAREEWKERVAWASLRSRPAPWFAMRQAGCESEKETFLRTKKLTVSRYFLLTRREIISILLGQ